MFVVVVVLILALLVVFFVLLALCARAEIRANPGICPIHGCPFEDCAGKDIY